MDGEIMDQHNQLNGHRFGNTLLAQQGLDHLTSCGGEVDEVLRQAGIMMQLEKELNSRRSSTASCSSSSGDQSEPTTSEASCSLSPVATSDSGFSSGAEGGNGVDEFRRKLEFIVGCFQYDVITKSDVFRDLIETFLHPAFETLQVPQSTLKIKSSSATSSAECSSAASSGSNPPPVSSIKGLAVPNSDCGNKIVTGTESLSCPVCFGFVVDPVTVACGHSYCKKCLQKESVGQACGRCSHVLTKEDVFNCKTNVLIGSLEGKWWPTEVRATQLRNEGNELIEKGQVEQALQKYAAVLDLTPTDHLTLGNRSQALFNMGRAQEALQDADGCIRYCPKWLKGYFRKSAALISLGRFEDALSTLITCIYVMKVTPNGWSLKSTSRAHVMNEVVKVVQKIFSQVTASSAGTTTMKRHGATRGSLQFCPYSRSRRRNMRRHSQIKRRPCPSTFSRGIFDWNDSESDSSGDEDDRHYDHTSSDIYFPSSMKEVTGSCWSWKASRGRYTLRSRQQCAASSIDPFTAQMDNLCARMKRLLRTANQELKLFEQRLKSPQLNAHSVADRRVDPTLVASIDMECSLCYRLFFQPVSTGCGHTFCRSCLERCLDHNPSCPLCKTSLEAYLANRAHAATEFLEVLLLQYLPGEHSERKSQHHQELNSLLLDDCETKCDMDVPIFVCTMAYPTIPCPLHVFEPRYRLMIRRCVENGSNRFGMCCYLTDGENNYGDIGTLLHIRNVQYFADGRSVVYTMGCRRFRVLHKSVVDGYNAGRIELLKDNPVPDTDAEGLKELHDKVYKETKEWLESVGQARRQRIYSHFGYMPPPEEDWMSCPDGPSWIWWLLAILPLENKAQLSILGMCSLSKRLSCISEVLKFVASRMSSIVD